MSENKEKNATLEATDKKPDDMSGILVEAKVKIFDPESGEVIVEGRA